MSAHVRLLSDWARAHITPVMLADVACRTFAKQLTPNIKARGADGHSSVSLAVRWGPYLCAGDLETSQHKARKESRAALASIRRSKSLPVVRAFWLHQQNTSDGSVGSLQLTQVLCVVIQDLHVEKITARAEMVTCYHLHSRMFRCQHT